jgi:hypothetical protein
MTDLFLKCNCSKAQTTLALRRKLVGRYHLWSNLRRDNDMEIMKPAYRTPSQGSRSLFMESMKTQRVKTVGHLIWKPLSRKAIMGNSVQRSISRKRLKVIQEDCSIPHSYIVRPDCGSLEALVALV